MSSDPQTSRSLLKLAVLPPSKIPAHTGLASAQDGGSVELTGFVTQLLTEGAHFADTTLPNDFKHQKIQHLPRSKGGDVEVLSGGPDVDDPAANDGRGEFWFARRSRHTLLAEGAKDERGKASWKEFEDALFIDHSVKEGEYTPDIYDAHKVLDWSSELSGKTIEEWYDIGLEIYEMAHAVQFPLDPRVFATLVLTARDSPSSFLTVQVPLDLSKVSTAKYSNGSNITSGKTAQEKKKAVFGRYTSVERVCKIDTEGSPSAVQWDMATASDAAGNLPMAVQKVALGSLIAKDVEYVMEWAVKRREKEKPKAANSEEIS